MKRILRILRKSIIRNIELRIEQEPEGVLLVVEFLGIQVIHRYIQVHTDFIDGYNVNQENRRYE